MCTAAATTTGRGWRGGGRGRGRGRGGRGRAARGSGPARVVKLTATARSRTTVKAKFSDLIRLVGEDEYKTLAAPLRARKRRAERVEAKIEQGPSKRRPETYRWTPDAWRAFMDSDMQGCEAGDLANG